MQRLPQVREIAMNFLGVDIIESPALIQPTAHYSMGGIPTDVDGQVIADSDGTPIIGLYAAGECACVSVHGANRLGTNSLLEASVFGRRTGYAIAKFIQSGPKLHPLPTSDNTRTQRQRIQTLMDVSSVNGKRLYSAPLAEELKWNMTNNCGIFRTGEKLQLGAQKLAELRQRFPFVRIMDMSKRFNTDLMAAIELDNLLLFSELIITGATVRTESRGAHYRNDYTTRDDSNWLKHTMAHLGPNGEPVLSYKSVTINWEKYPPQERKY